VLTRYIAKELGHRQIAVNGAQARLKQISRVARCVTIQRLNFIASQTALGRVGLPDDIGGAIASLLSEENRWVNAQN